jgi:hypothetical protein
LPLEKRKRDGRPEARPAAGCTGSLSISEKFDHEINVVFHGVEGGVGVATANGLIDGLVLFQDLDDVIRVW